MGELNLFWLLGWLDLSLLCAVTAPSCEYQIELAGLTVSHDATGWI
jgi:hypothetical protein